MFIEGEWIMTICKAVGMRIAKLLSERNMTLYRLEQKSGILHGTMMCIINERNKNVTLKTIYLLARGFDMTILEFLNDEVFFDTRLEVE